MAYYIVMKVTNLAEFKTNLSKFLSLVEKGEEIEICKRNIPIARLLPFSTRARKNQTKLGCGDGSVQVHGDLTEPLIPTDAWEMFEK